MLGIPAQVPRAASLMHSGKRRKDLQGASLIDCRSLAFVVVGISAAACDLKSSLQRVGRVVWSGWKVDIYTKANAAFC